MDGVTYRDIFEESGIKIFKTRDGRYRWKVESRERFSSPFAAMRDAMTVIGEQPLDHECDTKETVPEPWSKVTIQTQTDVEWQPIVPLR